MGTFQLTRAQEKQFQADGFLIIEALFSKQEMELLLRVAKSDRALEESALHRKDGSGGVSKLALWNEPGDDLYGLIARSRRVVDSMELLLGSEVYHWHSKMMLKEPFTGGAWEWHQDFGYWYNNGCLAPELASCLIAVDRANRENGCLQVLRGSHHLGRIDHGSVGQQTGANMERVEQALKRFELVYCETEPGSAIFFHSNLLHRSDQNRSPNSRWSLICCYNTKRNSPYKETSHAKYSPLQKVPDEAILAWQEKVTEEAR